MYIMNNGLQPAPEDYRKHTYIHNEVDSNIKYITFVLHLKYNKPTNDSVKCFK